MGRAVLSIGKKSRFQCAGIVNGGNFDPAAVLFFRGTGITPKVPYKCVLFHCIRDAAATCFSFTAELLCDSSRIQCFGTEE